MWQYHDKKFELAQIFDYFRFCANEAIRVGIEKHITSKFKLHHEMYYKLRSEFHSKYVLGAIECASSKLKSYKKINKKKSDGKTPFWKNHLTLDNQSYKLENNTIRIPIRPREYVVINLIIMLSSNSNVPVWVQSLLLKTSLSYRTQNKLQRKPP